VGIAVGIPTGTITRTVDAARTLAQAAATQQLTAPQKLQLFEASASFVSSPPSVGPHLLAAYSVRDDTEVNVQYASGAWRLGSRLQLLRRAAGPFDLVAGLGVSHAGQVASASIADVLPVVHLRGVQRWMVDLPIVLGTSRDWFRVWGGPKLAYTHVSAGAELDLVNGEKATASLTIRGIYWGAQAGLAVGYRALFIGLELTVLELVASGDAVTTIATPQIGLDVGGWLITPAVALMGEF
jgi:hypothetical protein